MKILALAAVSMLTLTPMLVTTTAEARPHMKRHAMHRQSPRMMKRMRGMHPIQRRQMRDAPASPLGGPVGSGRP